MTPNLTPTQIARARRGALRWFLLSAANTARPVGIYTEALLPIIQSVYPDATHKEIRTELDYLEERGLMKIKRDPTDRWFVDLTRGGVDVVEYTVECDPGIDRPKLTQA
jgi:hypothetical protein